MAKPIPLPIQTQADPPRADAWAWGVCWLLFASTVLNYMDRQAITLVGPQVRAEYHLRAVDFGWILAAFQLTYALAQVPAGFYVDRTDVRRTYAGAVAFWSAAGFTTAFAPGFGSLLAFRALLGVGESFNWPCALTVTARILPPADRGLGNGIFNSGAAIGAVVTPVIVTLLTQRYGWRSSFLLVGLLGLAWVWAWNLVVRGESGRRLLPRPKVVTQHDLETLPTPSLPAPSATLPARLTFAAVALIALLLAASAYRYGPAALTWAIAWLMLGALAAARILPLDALRGADWSASLGEIVRLRRFWVLAVVSISVNVCWHFLVGWTPTYLKDDRGMTFLASGLWTAVPFLAADLGNIGGGALSRRATRLFGDVTRGRLAVMAACTLLIASGATLGLVESNALVVVILAVMAMGTAAFMANYFALTQDVSPRHTGLVVGILGGLGNLFAGTLHPIAGMVKDTTGGLGPIFLLVGLLPFLGIGILLAAWGNAPPLEADPA